MKITKEQIKQIVKEEIAALDEKWSWEKFKKDIGWTKGVSPAEREEWEAMAKEKIAAGAAKKKAREQEAADWRAEKAGRAKKAAADQGADDAAMARRAKQDAYYAAGAKGRARAGKSDFERWVSDEGPDPAYNYMTRMEEKIYKRLEEMIRGKNEKA